MSNAIKFTDEGSVRLEIGEGTTDGVPAVTFTVSDTGIGIEDQDQARLFKAFEQLRKLRPNALLVATTALFTTRREQIVALAARHGIPASYSRREYVTGGGLMSYGPDYDDVYRLLGVYAARVLKGEKPADLPVSQETRIVLVVNLKTAKALGIKMPRDFLQRVDEVIQ